MAFLESAAMNYKYSFNDQVLIYAQRPESVACADIDTWNLNVCRWVNRGSKGIALITEINGYTSLRYVFDVADTNSKYGKSFRLWSIPKPYENDIIESLENKYGELENKETLAEAIKSVSKIIAEDNVSDYLTDILFYRDNSSLEYMSEENIKNILEKSLSNSVAFAIMKRCGLNPNDYFNETDFIDVLNFNSYETITRLGLATSEISEMGLREIYSTVKNLRLNEINKIRTFDVNSNLEYDMSESRNNAERSDYDGNDNLYQPRGLSNTRPSIRGEESPSSSEWQVRNDEAKILEGNEETSIHNITNERPINRTFDDDSRTSRDESGRNNISNENPREYNRGNETEQSNEMGRSYEQLESISRGDSNERTNLRIENYEKDESNRSFYVVLDEKINQIISKSPHKKESNSKIKEFFNNEKDIDERI
jgi:hypothetical protein